MQRKIDDEMRLATVSQAAPTEAPTVARAVGSRKAWRSRSAAAGVIALALGLAGCGGSSNNDPPVDAPPPRGAPLPPLRLSRRHLRPPRPRRRRPRRLLLRPPIRRLPVSPRPATS